MSFARTSLQTLTALCGFAFISADATAQDSLPTRSRDAVDEVTQRLSKESRGIPAEDLPKVKPLFLQFAKYYADIVANPIVYRATLDPKIVAGPPIPTLDDNRQTGIFFDLDRYILEPNLSNKVSNEKADYIRELGIAFDAALKPLIESHPERIVRINTIRVLARVCKSGAGAHWPTVTALLTSENTPTEVKHYAFQAAGNLLAAYDTNDYKSRKHSLNGKDSQKDLGNLVQVLMNCIANPTMIMPGLKGTEATPDQLAVVGFVRKHAVRALAQVRFVAIQAPEGRQLIYPSYALARVCVSDPALVPTPSPAECAEAAIGICNMAPAIYGNPIKNYNFDGAVEAVAAGIKTFAGPRADASDRSLPWRNYSTRIAEALNNWRPLFDPAFEATLPKAYDASAVPAAVNDLIGRIQTMILMPMDKVDFNGKPDPNAVLDIGGMERYLEQLRGNPNRKPLLFTNNPDTVLYAPMKK